MSNPPFQVVLDSHRDVVWRFLVAAVGQQEAEDCFQETFLAALRAYPRLRDGSNLRAWLLTIAGRKSIDAHRAARRRPPHVRESVQAVEPPDPALWRAVGALPPKQRAAVLYRTVGDLPYREIARALDCTEAAARQNAREGLAKLRERWKP